MSDHLPQNPPRNALQLHREMAEVWERPPGLRGWLSSVNHSEMGMRFMLTSFFFFGVAGVLSMLIRAQLATRNGEFLDVAAYNQVFTMHGTLMMFLFATPMFEGLAMYLLPRLLGSRELALPRVSALGWWCYLLGGMILLVALILGVAPDGGWFMYAPLSSKTHSPGVNADIWLLGITFIEVSAIAAAVEITASILRLRAPGMRLTQMPLMAWYLLGASVMMLVGFPPLILGSLLLELERAFDWPFFDVARGGDALLWQHLFWLFGHPEVYILFLPAAGVVSTVLPVMARTQILGYGAIVAAILGLVFLSFGLWVHHMFTVGIPHMALAFFSAASTLVALPTAVQIFLWIGTLWRGTPRMELPMLYLMGFFATFVMGGLTGVMLAIVPFNWQAHDTAFVTAHLHYVLIGGFGFPMMAGIVYWMPLISGRAGLPSLGRWAFWLIFVGFHGTFFLMHLTGLLGMPRRIAQYPDNPEWELLNLSSSFFGFVMAIGFALFAINLLLQARYGTRAGRAPWGEVGLEWRVPRFLPAYNLASQPLPQGMDALALARGEGALPGAPRGLAELVMVEPVSGKPVSIAVLPRPTMLPLYSGLAIGIFVLLLLFGLYVAAGVWTLALVVIFWQWGAPMFAPQDWPMIEIVPGIRLPLQFQTDQTLANSSMALFLVANGSFFASLLFGIGFLAVVAPHHMAPPQAWGLYHPLMTGAIAGALGLGSLCAHLARPLPGAVVNAAALLGALHLGLYLPDPTEHARFALFAVALGYVGVHALIAALLALHLGRQIRDGRRSATRPGAARLWQMWQDYAAVTALILAAVVLLQEVLA